MELTPSENEDFKIVRDHWHDEFLRTQGVTYVWSNGADQMAIKRLLKAGLSSAELTSIITKILETEEFQRGKWCSSHCRTLLQLGAWINRIRIELSRDTRDRPAPKPTTTTTINKMNYEERRAWLRRTFQQRKDKR